MEVHDVEKLKEDATKIAEFLLTLLPDELTEHDAAVWINAYRMVAKSLYIEMSEEDNPGSLILLQLVKENLQEIEEVLKN